MTPQVDSELMDNVASLESVELLESEKTMLGAESAGTVYDTLAFKDLVGTHDLIWITLDSLRFDVAQRAHEQGETPNLSSLITRGWECRHSAGTFTLPAHVAMFSGFLPTPKDRPKSGSIAAPRIPGIDSLSAGTFVFDEAGIPQALAARGYRTVCVGGVSFFANATPVSKVLPSYFQETFWSPRFGPGRRDSIDAQWKVAKQVLEETETPLMLFLNVATTHHPTAIYLESDNDSNKSTAKSRESVESQAASLRFADRELAPLCELLLKRRLERPAVLIVCADHGDAFGEDGLWGHRLSHPTVLNVPYAHVVLDATTHPHHVLALNERA
jgi:membrane-anchored protein YejM (alkaline phosphatase superfamily)